MTEDRKRELRRLAHQIAAEVINKIAKDTAVDKPAPADEVVFVRDTLHAIALAVQADELGVS